MIKAISYWAMQDGLTNTCPIDQALSQARDAGFQGLELAIDTQGVLHTQTTQNECDAIRKLIDQSGIKVETIAAGLTWGCNPISNDKATREQSISLHTAALERAAWLGAKAMLMVPGVVSGPLSKETVRYDLAIERCHETIEILLETAEKLNIDLCLENVWNGLFYSPLEFASFIDSFKSNRLGIYFDVGNLIGYHQYPPHWIELLGERIKRVHIKDFAENFGFTGGYQFCALGAGQVPWPETMAALKAINYDGTIVAEQLPWDIALLNRTSAEMDVIFALPNE